MGEVMRRYWILAIHVTDVSESDCPPARVRLLGEGSWPSATAKVGSGFLRSIAPLHSQWPLMRAQFFEMSTCFTNISERLQAKAN
jgi:hypothetical protein